MTNDLSTDFADAAGVALVIGGSGGLGAAIAEMLAARGSDVAVTFRGNEDAGNAVATAAAEHGKSPMDSFQLGWLVPLVAVAAMLAVTSIGTFSTRRNPSNVSYQQ